MGRIRWTQLERPWPGCVGHICFLIKFLLTLHSNLKICAILSLLLHEHTSLVNKFLYVFLKTLQSFLYRGLVHHSCNTRLWHVSALSKMVYFHIYASKLSLAEIQIQWIFSFTCILSIILLKLLCFHNVTSISFSAMASLVFSVRNLSYSHKGNTSERRFVDGGEQSYAVARQ